MPASAPCCSSGPPRAGTVRRPERNRWRTSWRSAPQCSTAPRSEEHTSELQSRGHLVCRLLLEKKNHLIWQLRLSKITEQESAIGDYMIQNLNENGYLAGIIAEICHAPRSTPEDSQAIPKRTPF